MRAIIDALGVPGAKGPNLVDDPSFVTLAAATRVRRHDRSVADVRVSDRSRMPEPHRLVYPLGQQQLDVLEQKASAICWRYRSWSAAVPKIGRLRENPGISEHPTAHQYAFDARLHPFDDLDGLHA